MRYAKSLTFLALLTPCSFAFAQQYVISTIAGGGPPYTPAVGVNVSIGQPLRVAADSSGNIYFSSSNSVFRLDAGGTLTLVAGNSKPGFSGDGGPATNALLNSPQGLAVDAAGNVYIADSGNNRVRKVSPSGVITTVAGNGSPGLSGDTGPATSAQLHLPSGVAVDSSGNLYIADTANYVVRKVTADGIITSFAGNTLTGYAGDGVPAYDAVFSSIEDVAVDANGNVYIADTGNGAIRKVDSTATITTVAGTGVSAYSGDGGQATKAQLYSPYSVALDSSGNMYIAEYADSRIRKVTSQGTISTIAGTGAAGYGGDNGPAASAQLNSPEGVAVDAAGNVYIADVWNNRIRKISSSGTISTVAGNGLISYSGDGFAAIHAQLNAPEGVAVDAAGMVYISDTANNRVRAISPGGVINTIAGNGTAGSSGDGGPAASAQLNQPLGLALDAAGNLYIADFGNSRVRKVSPGGAISTVAGTNSSGYAGDGGPATNAELSEPFGVAVDGAGNLYISEFGNSRVRKVSADGTITTVAGTGSTTYGGDGGPATNAALKGPEGVALDAAGNLYIADTGNHRIRQVSPAGIITTVAGTGAPGVSGDGGQATEAQLVAPSTVTVDVAGNLYIADESSRIRRVAPDGTIATIAGSGVRGYAGDGGPATNAQLNSPAQIAVDPAGELYVADAGNSAVRLLAPVSYGTKIAAVTNGADSVDGPIAPGEVVVLYGSGLGPSQLQTYQLDADGAVGTNLGGTRVLFNGTPAPILYTWATQVAAVVPYAVNGSTAQIIAQYQNQTSAPLTISVDPSAPGLFTLDSSGKGQAAAFNQDGTANHAGNPAAAGSTIVLFATGAGETTPAGVDGLPANPAALPVAVTIGGITVQAQSAGGVPGLAPGVIQIRAQIPSGVVAGGQVPVSVQVGDSSSQRGVTIAVSGS